MQQLRTTCPPESIGNLTSRHLSKKQIHSNQKRFRCILWTLVGHLLEGLNDRTEN